MPVNNTPIAPKDEITGHATLPLSRVKRIIATDDELSTTTCSNTAAFAITIATQHFLTYLVSQTHNVVKAERTPRKTIQYRDVGEFPLPFCVLAFNTFFYPPFLRITGAWSAG